MHTPQAAEFDTQNCKWWQDGAKPTTNMARNTDVELFWEKVKQHPAEVSAMIQSLIHCLNIFTGGMTPARLLGSCPLRWIAGQAAGQAARATL
jgi:hypothetical protein